MPERCHGITQAGARCRRVGAEYCYQHASRSGNVPAPQHDSEPSRPATGKVARREDMAALVDATRRQLASIDTNAIFKAYQRQLASIDTNAIFKAYQRQLASIDTNAIFKAYQRQLASIDTNAIFKAYQRQLASIDTNAIFEAYRVSIASYITSPTGQESVERAAQAVAHAQAPVGEAPAPAELDDERLAVISEAIVDLGNLEGAPDVSDMDGFDWMVATTIYEVGGDRNESGPNAVQTAIMTAVIVAALSTLIAGSPALTAVFGVLSIPVTLWPFIQALVVKLNNEANDDPD